MGNENFLATEPEQFDNAINVLVQFKNDPKAQRCLDIYQKLPEMEQDILLFAMDAFVMGWKQGSKDLHDSALHQFSR